MSKIIDVSNKLGEYMVKGWVLTDSPCPAESCRGVPLLKSPNGQQPVVHYCANCNWPPKSMHDPHFASADVLQQRTAQQSEGTQSQSSSTVSSGSHDSRPSTPPTEFSSTLSSPTFAPPVETEEMIRRRQQSDQASTEIGKRLLKGWAMLGEECLNSRCYGVPLVRPPKSGLDKDPRKECVICRTVYISEDSDGWQRLIPISSESSTTENGLTASAVQQGSSNNGKAVSQNSPQPLQLPTLDPPLQTPKLTVNISHRTSSELNSSQLVTAFPPATVSVDAPIQALELALGVLSERLAMACATPSLVDPQSIAAHAEAISKVAHALGQVEQLRHQTSPQGGLMS